MSVEHDVQHLQENTAALAHKFGTEAVTYLRPASNLPPTDESAGVGLLPGHLAKLLEEFFELLLINLRLQQQQQQHPPAD